MSEVLQLNIPRRTLFNRAGILENKNKLSNNVYVQYKYYKVSTLEKNIRTLCKIGALPSDWNTYGAKPFGTRIIDNAIELLKKISKQPSFIAPTGRETIQFDFNDKPNGRYLEMEIGKDNIGFYYEGFVCEFQQEFDIKYDTNGIDVANKLINYFYE